MVRVSAAAIFGARVAAGVVCTQRRRQQVYFAGRSRAGSQLAADRATREVTGVNVDVVVRRVGDDVGGNQ